MNKLQERVRSWVIKCFGLDIANDRNERNERFLEEALELVQSAGLTKDQAHNLVDYVYARPKGEIEQEVGGVTVTLDALCSAHNIDREACEETEINRIWGNIDKIRDKQKKKPSMGVSSNLYPERES